MERLALERSYRRAIYRVRLESATLDLRVGELAPELDGAARWGFITAVNPGSSPLPEAENRRRLARLEARLERRGWERRPGEGLDPERRWPAEASFLVVGADEPELAELAAAFGQAAFLAGEVGSPPRLVFVADAATAASRRRPGSSG